MMAAFLIFSPPGGDKRGVKPGFFPKSSPPLGPFFHRGGRPCPPGPELSTFLEGSNRSH
jgi:hypothetical protein